MKMLSALALLLASQISFAQSLPYAEADKVITALRTAMAEQNLKCTYTQANETLTASASTLFNSEFFFKSIYGTSETNDFTVEINETQPVIKLTRVGYGNSKETMKITTNADETKILGIEYTQLEVVTVTRNQGTLTKPQIVQGKTVKAVMEATCK